MNIENIKRVRDRIADLPDEKFDMDYYFGNRDGPWFGLGFDPGKTHAQQLEGSCGTTACIAGHALALLDPSGRTETGIATKAADLLGLPYEVALALFEPHANDAWFIGSYLSLADVTRAQAVRVLDHLIETGEVDWSVAQ